LVMRFGGEWNLLRWAKWSWSAMVAWSI
jgi:hypothetical protein